MEMERSKSEGKSNVPQELQSQLLQVTEAERNSHATEQPLSQPETIEGKEEKLLPQDQHQPYDRFSVQDLVQLPSNDMEEPLLSVPNQVSKSEDNIIAPDALQLFLDSTNQ
jgi:hypothetical protein